MKKILITGGAGRFAQHIKNLCEGDENYKLLLPTKQDIPHITIATSPTGNPKDSNDLLASAEINSLEPFTASGVVEEVS